MKKIFTLLIIISVSSTLGSCYYDKFQPIIDDPTAEDVSFATDIQPLFDANCIACHAGSLNPDLREGNSYTAITGTGMVVANDLTNSELYQRLLGNGNIMPPSGALSATKTNLVKNWILQGAKNN
jgi:mono/diheme cytochrome c family protein